MSSTLTPGQIPLPPQAEGEMHDLIHGSIYRAPNFLPSEIVHNIIGYFGLIDQLQLRAINTIWRNVVNEGRNWRRIDLTPLNGFRVTDELRARLMPVWPSNHETMPPLVIELILPDRSPIRDDYHWWYMFLHINRDYLQRISIAYEILYGSVILLGYLPTLTALRSLRLEGANSLLMLSNPIDEVAIVPRSDQIPLPVGQLTLPTQLEELRIVSVGILIAETGWTVTGRLVRLDLEYVPRPVPRAGNVLDLDILVNLAPTLRYMRLTRCRVRGLPTALGNRILDNFLALEELEIMDCNWEAHTNLPSNLRRLSVEDGRISVNSRLNREQSALPHLVHLSIRGVERLNMDFLSQLLTVGNVSDGPNAGLRRLEIIWSVFQNTSYNHSFPDDTLQAILQRHGNTLEELTIACRGLPPSTVDDIRLNCPSLLRLFLSARSIGWFAVRTIVRHVQNTGWGLRRLDIIHWNDNYNVVETRNLVAALNQLGIEHNIERSAAPW